MRSSAVSKTDLQPISWRAGEARENGWILSTQGLSELGIQLPPQRDDGPLQTLLVVVEDHLVRVLVATPGELPDSVATAFSRLSGQCFHAGTAVSDQPDLEPHLRADAARLNAWLGEYPEQSVAAASGLGHTHLPLQTELQRLAAAGAGVRWNEVLPTVSGFFERRPAAATTQSSKVPPDAQAPARTYSSLATLQRGNVRLPEATRVTQIYAIGLR